MPQHNHHHNATRKPSPSSFSPLLLHLLVMASLLSLFLLSLLLFSFPSSSSSSSSLRGALKSRPRRGPWASKSQLTLVSQACNATRFPDVCLSSLANSSLPPNPATVDVIRSAVGVSLAGLSTAQSMAQEILDSSAGNVNRSNAARNCLEVLADSRRRAEATSGDALMRGGTKDARAWMSASLLFQYDCSNALKYANDTALTAKTMLFLDSLMELTSNALAMAFALDAFGNDTASWAPPRTERDGFWGWAGHVLVGPDRRGTPVGSLKADVTVCKEGGGCDYGTVQEAVNAAPENLAPGKRFVIKIKAGVYEEIVRVPTEKRNLVFLGDGMGKTVLSNSLTAGPGISTYNTATVAVLGDGFMASGLTIQNTAPPPTHQAVAFRCDSDLSLLENCEFLGNQDTLYAHSLRQYYRSCRFEGNVDFIFGNSAAVFEDCIILVRPRQLKPEKGETNAVTAHGRTDPAQSTGFVFWNCLINGTDEYMALFRSKPSVHKNYLGRPWKEYSRTVFINSTMEAIINSQGWLPWTGDFALKTLYYGEFGNTGPGSDTSQRVSWSSQIPAEHVWKMRNTFIFDGIKPDPMQAVQIAEHSWREWTEAKATGHEVAVVDMVSQTRKWVPPQPNEVIVNCDASWINEDHDSGVAVVARNSRGQIIGGQNLTIRTHSSLSAEVSAIKTAADFCARCFNVTQVSQSDCKIAVDFINEQSSLIDWRSEIEAVIARWTIKNLANCSLVFSPRKTNEVANWVADEKSPLSP